MRAFATLSLGITVLISACGGSSGSESSPPPAPSPTPSPNPLVQLSGGIAPARGLFVDSDTNDPQSTRIPNDDANSAQVLTLPGLVAGYARCFFDEVTQDCAPDDDDVDTYVAGLIPGQTLVMEVASDGEDDLDLAVFSDQDSDGDGLLDLVASSINAGSRSEQINFDGPAGTYFILVFAFAGESNYVLSLGQLDFSGSATDAGFVSDEILVRWRPTAAKTAARQRHDLRVMDEATEGYSRYRLNRSKASARPWPAHPDFAPLPNSPELRTRLTLKALQQDPAVAAVALNHIRRASRVPNDEFFGLQWNLTQIRAPQAWDITQGEATVRVAVLDTGIIAGHPELDSLIDADGFDFISDPTIAGDGDGPDSNPQDVGDGEILGESSFHGTHVSGTVAAETDNGVGIAGVSWNTRLVPLRVLGKGGGTDFDIVQAIRYAAGLSNSSGRTITPVDVINMSLGSAGSCADSALEAAIQAARAAGVIVIAAAGNESTDLPSVPASCAGTVSVSATDINEQLAFYSNFGSSIDVAAPGGDGSQDQNNDGFGDGILSSFFNEEFREFTLAFQNGTSMAAPHVAGVAALMKAQAPSLSPADFDALLASGAQTRDLGSSGRDNRFGHGLIDASLAVRAATTAPEPFLVAEPNALNLGLADSLSFNVRNGASQGQISVTQISDNGIYQGGDWLSVVPIATDADGLGTYRANVDRSRLPAQAASFSAAIDIAANSGQVLRVPVSVSTVSATQAGVLGTTYVLLIDAEDNVAGQVIAQRSGDRYSFSFGQVAPGAYLVIAGTDHDNDGFICDAGEACGGFPTLDELEAVNLSSSRNLMDFLARVEISLSSSTAAAKSQIGPRAYELLPAD